MGGVIGLLLMELSPILLKKNSKKKPSELCSKSMHFPDKVET